MCTYFIIKRLLVITLSHKNWHYLKINTKTKMLDYEAKNSIIIFYLFYVWHGRSSNSTGS